MQPAEWLIQHQGMMINLVEFLEKKYTEVEPIQEYVEEQYYGPIEYKFMMDQSKVAKLSYQMSFRLEQGRDTCWYYIGLHDNGDPEGLPYDLLLQSLRVLYQMVQSNKAIWILEAVPQGKNGKLAIFKVRRFSEIVRDIRIAMIGDSGAGKTTHLGVLVTGNPDNGTGSARLNFSTTYYAQTVLQGKTVRKKYINIGFDMNGDIVNRQYNLEFNFSESQEEFINQNSARIVTFIDEAGSKTSNSSMIQTINQEYPDYALLYISASVGVESQSKYLELIRMLDIPFFIVISHIDKVSKDQLDDFCFSLKSLIDKHLGKQAVVFNISRNEDIKIAVGQMIQGAGVFKLIPLFMINNLDLASLDLYTRFLSYLQPTCLLNQNTTDEIEFCIHHLFEIDVNQKKEKIIVGTVVKGSFKIEQLLMIGPDKYGRYFTLKVIEIRQNQLKVNLAKCGQVCSIRFSIQNNLQAPDRLERAPFCTDQNQLREGMVLISPKQKHYAITIFEADVFLHESSEVIRVSRKQVIVLTQFAKQACEILVEEVHEPLSLVKRSSRSQDPIQKSKLQQQKKAAKIPTSKQAKEQQQFEQQTLKFPQKQVQREDQVQPGQCEDAKRMKRNKSAEKIAQEDKWVMLLPGKNRLTFKFKHYPEYVTPGMKIVINEQISYKSRIVQLWAWGFVTAPLS